MGLEQLCREITATAEARANALVKEAQAQAATALAQAKTDGQRCAADAKSEGDAFGAAEYAERVEGAKAEAQKELAQAREEAVRHGMDAVWERFRAQSQRPGYAKNMRRWAEMAVSELDSRDYVLRERAQDMKLLSDAGFKVSKEPIECSGGVRAEVAGGKISVDYTLEALFEGKREEAYKEVYARLFSDEEGQALQARAKTKGQPGAKRGAANANAKPSPARKTSHTSRMRVAGKKSKKSKRGRR